MQIAPATTYTNAGEYQEPQELTPEHCKKPASEGFLRGAWAAAKKDPQKRFEKDFLRRGEAAARGSPLRLRKGLRGGACFDEAQANIKNPRK